jgi:hypothetical protein
MLSQAQQVRFHNEVLSFNFHVVLYSSTCLNLYGLVGTGGSKEKGDKVEMVESEPVVKHRNEMDVSKEFLYYF